MSPPYFLNKTSNGFVEKPLGQGMEEANNKVNQSSLTNPNAPCRKPESSQRPNAAQNKIDFASIDRLITGGSATLPLGNSSSPAPFRPSISLAARAQNIVDSQPNMTLLANGNQAFVEVFRRLADIEQERQKQKQQEQRRQQEQQQQQQQQRASPTSLLASLLAHGQNSTIQSAFKQLVEQQLLSQSLQVLNSTGLNDLGRLLAERRSISPVPDLAQAQGPIQHQPPQPALGSSSAFNPGLLSSGLCSQNYTHPSSRYPELPVSMELKPEPVFLECPPAHYRIKGKVYLVRGTVKRWDGKRFARCCEVKSCTKLAQGPTSFCKSHGGGTRCKEPDCQKAARGGYLYCTSHGGPAPLLSPGSKRSRDDESDAESISNPGNDADIVATTADHPDMEPPAAKARKVVKAEAPCQ